MKKQIILLSGKQGSGKTTTSRLLESTLEKRGYSTKLIKFADIIYEIEAVIWDFLDDIGYKWQKADQFIDTLDTIIWKVITKHGIERTREPDFVLQGILLKHIGDPIQKNRPDKPLLQVLGTEWGRDTIDKDIWANIGRNKAAAWLVEDKNNIVIIDDARFENEFDIFPDALRVRLHAPEHIRKTRAHVWRENTTHPSETSLDKYDRQRQFDLMIDTETNNIQQVNEQILDTLKGA